MKQEIYNSSSSKQVFEWFIYNKKDNDWNKTEEKNIALKYLWKQKNPNTGYYDDVVLQEHILLQDFVKNFNLWNKEDKEILDWIKNQKSLFIEKQSSKILTLEK